MQNIKIVTAFFDIGRENFSNYPRSNDQYFDYFRFWARIQNNMVIYCDPQNCEKIFNIRKSFGLENRTEIVSIENIYAIEQDLYARMKEIENLESFRSFRYYHDALSNGAQYDYIMLIKWWCLKDAATRTNPEDFLAWIDFGYNHGDKWYLKSEEFDFLWEYSFPQKITAFCLNDPNQTTSIDVLQFQKDCFIGGSLVLPQTMCAEWWERIKEAMWSLISLDCIDDDQQLLLMIYKKYTDDFNIIICDWFEAFSVCSNQNFTTKGNTKQIQQPEQIVEPFKISLATRICNKIRRRMNLKKQVRNKEEQNPFIKQMIEKVKTYYGE